MLSRLIKTVFLTGLTLAILPTATLSKPVERYTRYNVTIHTSHKGDAGTDSNIMIQFHTADGYYSKTYTLATPGDSFERNRWDIVIVDSPKDYGKLEAITLDCDGTGKAAGWLPDKVFVTNLRSGARYDFVNFDDKWIGCKGYPKTLKLLVADDYQYSKKGLERFIAATNRAITAQRERAKGKSTSDYYQDVKQEAKDWSEIIGNVL